MNGAVLGLRERWRARELSCSLPARLLTIGTPWRPLRRCTTFRLLCPYLHVSVHINMDTSNVIALLSLLSTDEHFPLNPPDRWSLSSKIGRWETAPARCKAFRLASGFQPAWVELVVNRPRSMKKSRDMGRDGARIVTVDGAGVRRGGWAGRRACDGLRFGKWAFGTWVHWREVL